MTRRQQKVIVFESDDWGGLERGIPNRATYRRLAEQPDVARAVNSHPGRRRRFHQIQDTLESCADLEALFSVLEHYRGGDGRPAVFTPICLLASPDYRAIRANGYTQYVDIGIDQPYPRPYRTRGDIIAKAREGLQRGVWVPESHNTRMAAHINPHAWVRLLREKRDRALNVFFRHHMIGWPADVPLTDWGKEFDSMDEPALRSWVATGTRYFKGAFGYAPRVSGIADARSRCKVLENVMQQILVEHGVKVIINARNHEIGAYDRKWGLTYIRRNVTFEPLSRPRGGKVSTWRTAFGEIEQVWDHGQPAIVNTHRLHYVSMNPDLKAESLRQLERLLDTIHRRHPDAVYRSSHELARGRQQA